MEAESLCINEISFSPEKRQLKGIKPKTGAQLFIPKKKFQESRTFAPKVEKGSKGICNPRLCERIAGLQIQLEQGSESPRKEICQ